MIDHIYSGQKVLWQQCQDYIHTFSNCEAAIAHYDIFFAYEKAKLTQ
jgi:hypothetical protein